METGHNKLKRVVAVISAVLTGLFGLVAGPLGVIIGLITGFLVGHYYVHFSLMLFRRDRLSRLFLRTLYGALAGAIASFSVYLTAGVGIALAESAPGTTAKVAELAMAGAIIGMIIGAPFGFILACIIPYLQKGEEPIETCTVQKAPQGLTLSPKDAELILTIYPALKEHNLFDLNTALAYRTKFGVRGSQVEMEARYAQALAWLQARRPGFTLAQWEQANALTRQLVSFVITKGAGGEAGLEALCPGLGEEFYGWIAKAARLFW